MCGYIVGILLAPTGLLALSSTGDCLDLSQVLVALLCGVQFHGGKDVLLKVRTIEVCLLWRLLPGTGMKCLAPSYRLGWYHPHLETILLCSLKTRWLFPAELASAKGMAGYTKPELVVYSFWGS